MVIDLKRFKETKREIEFTVSTGIRWYWPWEIVNFLNCIGKCSLNPEKSKLETISKENYVEKCMFHFPSSNFNEKQMPYEDTIFARYLGVKYL